MKRRSALLRAAQQLRQLAAKCRIADALAATLIIAAAVALLWRPTFGGQVFLPLDLLAHMPPWRYSYERTPIANPISSDLVLEYFPRRLLASRMMRAGQLPLWNPRVMGGMPLLADGYSALLYPPSLLFVVLPVGAAFGWYALLHLILAGLGTYWLARTLGLLPVPALLAALTYMGCGFTMTWLAFPEFSAVIAWLPVALACVERYEAAGGGRRAAGWLLGVTCALALCVLCQLQLAFYAGAGVTLFWLLRRLLAAPRRLPGAALTLAGAAALALLLSAAQWLPTFELALQSQRGGAVGDVTGGALGVGGLLRFLAPVAFGRERTPPAWGPAQIDSLYPYVGLLPLLLAVVGAWRASTPARLALLLLALVTLTLAAVPTALLAAVPGLNQLPAVYRWTLVLSLALALLAGLGLQDLLARPDPTNRALRARSEAKASSWYAKPSPRALGTIAHILCLASAAVLVGAAMWHLRLFTPQSRYGEYLGLLLPQLRATPVAVGLAALALVALLAALRRPLTPWPTLHAMLTGVAPLLVAVDLGYYGWGAQSSARPEQLFQPTSDLTAAIGSAALGHAYDEEQLYPPTRFSAVLAADPGLYRIFGADYPSLQPNTFSVYGAQDVRGYASLFAQRYLQFARRWEGKAGDGAGWSQVYLTQAYNGRALLDLMGVRYVFFNPRSPNEARYGGLELIERNDEGAVYRNPTALPRAFLVHRVEQMPDDEALLRRLTAPGFPISTTALLAVAPPPLAAPPANASEEAQVVRYAPLEVDVTVRAAAPALLMLSDTYYPGWQATLDGEPTPIYAADAVLRGVAVPAGDHHVSFRYWPRSFAVGAALSVLGLLVVGAAAIRALRRPAR